MGNDFPFETFHKPTVGDPPMTSWKPAKDMDKTHYHLVNLFPIIRKYPNIIISHIRNHPTFGNQIWIFPFIIFYHPIELDDSYELMDVMESYIYPRCSMYGIFTYIRVIFRVNVGKYSIHGSSG